eukprot:CAMPEP_0173147262 /NCGR_PEP_ID=MMETSP1105-20130129/9031_1 /TAXON_ID=2985 /ORGANISM="Ochromonas sp., Strain BG-1" /LENGTH=250 /DNA_ID=CAMNT_0014061715 /DNA_START=34 /DNA_END=783 /DNA_ORIENTATION=+
MGGSLAPGYSSIPQVIIGKDSPRGGGGTSPANSDRSHVFSIDDAIVIVLPLYYTKSELVPEELADIRRIWRMIVNNQCPHFNEYQAQQLEAGGEKPPERCADYFLQLYYGRLFDVHPSSKKLFENSQTTRMRVHFISLMTMLFDAVGESDGRFSKPLEALARGHNRIGVRAVEYGIGGEILMHCLKKCVGPDVYTFSVHYAFTKFFSRMLDVIVPLVIQQELNGTLGGTNMSASESRPSSPTNTNTTEVE